MPGLPLAIARPDAQVVLIEATGKKARFLQETVKTLGLANVRVLAQRAEDAGHGKHRQSFDVAVARAVAELAMLAEWCLPLLKKNGKMLAMKGPKAITELPAARRAISLLGGGQPIVHAVKLPHVQNHLIVEIPKLTATQARYPRPASVAKGRPLG